MPISRRMDKEAVVHIHHGILLSYKKEHIWVSSNEVDETGAHYTDWSKPEREKQHSILMRMYGIQKDSNNTPYARQQKRHRCKEQTFWLWRRRRGWDNRREGHWDMCFIIWIDDQCKFNAWGRELKAGALGQPRGWWGGRREGLQDGDTCTPVADSCRYVSKTTTTL